MLARRRITTHGRGFFLVALALSALAAPAHAVTHQASFQVRALVTASCALPAIPVGLAANREPLKIACARAPSLSAIVAPPPRTIMDTTESGDTLMVLEF